MANHDYIIANQGFPAFRADLNGVLQAVVSNNSSASEPSTKYAYQMWYETDTNKWYMRNADNDAWIQLALFNQTNDTVNFIDSSSTVVGIATSATNTVLTLANGSVAINPAGFVSVGGAATQAGEIRFLEDTDNGTNYIALRAGTLSGNVTLTLPTADGSTGQFLKTDGSGNLAFETVTSSGGDVTLNGTQTLTNKTLTAPKIGTSILDTNGNELAKLTATSSAVNEFTIANSASSSAPKLSSTGNDTNIDLEIQAKGNGHLTIMGDTNAGAIQLNCESNSHGQQIKSQPHSAQVTNTMLMPAGADSTLVSLVSADTLTNKTLTSPKINENVAVTSTATELNKLDGATVTTAEINLSDLATLGTTASSKIFTADANNLTKVSGAVLNVEDTLSDGSTIAWNVINSPVAKVTLGGNRTFSAPSGSTPASGQFVSLLLIQDGTGGRTITWNAVYEFALDTAPTLTATANLGDIFTFRYNGAKWLEVGRNLALTLS